MTSKLSPVSVLFHEAWRNYKETLPVTGRLALVLGLISQLFILIPRAIGENYAGLAGVISIAGFFVMLWFGITLTIAMYFAVSEKGISDWRSYYDRSRPFWGRFLVVNIIRAIITVVGFILFIIPGFIALVRFAVADWVVLFEGLTGRDALRRSSAYVKGKAWAVFGAFILFILTILPAEILLALATPKESISTIEFIVLFIVNTAVYTAITPWAASFMNTLYADLRKTEMAPESLPEMKTTV